jgi:hypothetical protein
MVFGNVSDVLKELGDEDLRILIGVQCDDAFRVVENVEVQD